MTIGIIGCGHMGSAIGKGLLAAGKKLYLANPSQPALFKKQRGGNIQWTTDNQRVAVSADIIFIGVRPHAVQSVLEEISTVLRPRQILISIAAAINLKKLSRWSGGHKKIIRVMPNLPAQVFEGMSVWKSSPGIQRKEKKIVKKILNSFGKELEVRDESLLNAATASSAGAPAYLGAFLESMAAAAHKLGFSQSEARRVALQAARGAVAYFEKTGLSFGEVKKAVQTKGGTTEAAFKVLQKKKWQKIFEEALHAAYKKAQKLGS